MIKLLTPFAEDYTDEYNAWLASFPNHIHALVFVIKRFYRPEWGEHWREHFSVDIINGAPGHELKCEWPQARRQLPAGRAASTQARGGPSSCARTSSPADKVQMEDDITASVVVPAAAARPACPATATGRQPQARAPTASSASSSGPTTRSTAASTGRPRRTWRAPDNFSPTSSRSPPSRPARIVEDVAEFDEFTAPMQAARSGTRPRPDDGYVVCSAHPRLVDGKPTQEPALPPDPARPRSTRGDRYVAELGMRLARRLPAGTAAAVPGRRRARRAGGTIRPTRGRHPPARGLQPDPLPGAARAVHGLHLLADRQVALDHRRRLRGRAHQGTVQRAAADRRPQQRARLLHPHRLGRLLAPPPATSARRCGSTTTSAC